MCFVVGGMGRRVEICPNESFRRRCLFDFCNNRGLAALNSRDQGIGKSAYRVSLRGTLLEGREAGLRLRLFYLAPFGRNNFF